MLAILAIISMIAIPIGILIWGFQGAGAVIEAVFTTKLGVFILCVMCFPAINWTCGLVGLDSEEIAGWGLLGIGYTIKYIFLAIWWVISSIFGI
ncbi:MAG: hypothetical protein NTY74_14820 [Ignavibacteriae bacterium]|nr:hypothetical protein [Ignavibacteriota bacterium]